MVDIQDQGWSKMKTKLLEQIYTHAESTAPKECCGLVYIHNGREKYHPCNNLATGDDHFVIDPKDYIFVEEKGEITKIVHSHPRTNPKPSQPDLVGIEQTQLPWVIVNPLTHQHTETFPSGYEAPYVGREFCAGVLDCLSIIIDYHKRELNIEIPNYDRQDKWWLRGQDLYRDLYKDAGFVKKDSEAELEIHDTIIMFSEADVPNHAAIYLGEGKILHHVQGRLSSRDIYGGYWLKNTWAVLRHKQL